MTDILKDIASTMLEGSVKWVDTDDMCNKCGYVMRTEYQDIKYWDTKLGAAWQNLKCYACKEPANYTVIKVMPSKDQNDWF